ncbi:methyltransferase domain-containing protein [Kaistia algarum]|nr:transcription antitermination factor NusB [Kaistia algarum]MCX5514120.1 methyltransferase domain-containing protein [Kaistia algarum]
MSSVPGLAARAAAAAALDAILSDGRQADAVLESSDGPFAALETRERALARAILGMSLRRHGQIRDALGRFLDKPLPRKSGRMAAILDTAIAQILFMEVADHAAVSLAVSLADADRDARHFKGLANAVLRRVAGARDEIVASQDAPKLNTPPWLLKSWTRAYGEATALAIASAQVSEPSLDLSVKSQPAEWAERLGGIVLPTGSIRLASHGPLEALPGYADGEWWVQDAAAALPARLLGDIAGKSVIDLCAAPGGKTAQLAVAGAKVTAVDISDARLARVRQNLARLRLDATVVAADAGDYLPAEPVDAVLLDAPCSATGTIRRHPDVALLKRPQDVTALVEIQARLLQQATRMLKPGGTLVYCTCSLQTEEGEAQIHRALAELPLALEPIQPSDVGGVGEICRNGFLRSLPSDLVMEDARLSGLDGFFAARLRKLG